MGTWRMSADLLARARFVVSPYADVVAALAGLTEPRTPTERALAALHGDAFRAMLERHPGRAAVLAHSFRPGWTADYLCLPPRVARCRSPTISALLEERGDRQVRADLLETSGGPLPRVLRGAGVAAHAAGLLDWVWVHVVATDWPRRERVLRADIVARTSRLAAHGWEAVLADLGRDRAWLGHGELQINVHDHPTRDLGEASELLVRAGARPGQLGRLAPARAATPSTTRSPGCWPGLESGRPGAADRLLGPNRARLLVALGRPRAPPAWRR